MVSRLDVVVGSPSGDRKLVIDLWPNYPVGNGGEFTFSTLPRDYFSWGQLRREAYGMMKDSVTIKTNYRQQVIGYEYTTAGRSQRSVHGDPYAYDYQCVINR